MTDELASLVAAAQRGDHKAFDDLVRATHLDTFTLARRLVGNEEDAKDVVQEAYLRAYKSIQRFRGDSQFTTWMYRITANCASTHLSKRSRRRTEILNVDDVLVDENPDHDPEAVTDMEVERKRLAAAVDALPETLRSVIVLRDIYGMTHEEIAEQLGISEATAKVRLHRARKKLRERLFPLPGEAAARAV